MSLDCQPTIPPIVKEFIYLSVLLRSDLFLNFIHRYTIYSFAFLRPDRFPLVDDGYDVLRHKDLIDELLQAVKQKGMYLEINPHLAADKGDLFYTYPQVQILEWALARDVRFSYGSDAHIPEHVGVLLRELERHPVYGKALADWENTRI